jgi:hypothetical protein
LLLQRENRELAAFDHRFVHQLHPQLLQLSTHRRQVIVENSGQAIAPDAIVQAVHEVVTQVRT